MSYSSVWGMFNIKGGEGLNFHCFIVGEGPGNISSINSNRPPGLKLSRQPESEFYFVLPAGAGGQLLQHKCLRRRWTDPAAVPLEPNEPQNYEAPQYL